MRNLSAFSAPNYAGWLTWIWLCMALHNLWLSCLWIMQGNGVIWSADHLSSGQTSLETGVIIRDRDSPGIYCNSKYRKDSVYYCVIIIFWNVANVDGVLSASFDRVVYRRHKLSNHLNVKRYSIERRFEHQQVNTVIAQFVMGYLY